MIFVPKYVSRVVFKGGILGSACQFCGNPYLYSTTVPFDSSKRKGWHQKARPAQGCFPENIQNILQKYTENKYTHIHTPKTSYIAPKNNTLQPDEKHFDLSLKN